MPLSTAHLTQCIGEVLDRVDRPLRLAMPKDAVKLIIDNVDIHLRVPHLSEGVVMLRLLLLQVVA